MDDSAAAALVASRFHRIGVSVEQISNHTPYQEKFYANSKICFMSMGDYALKMAYHSLGFQPSAEKDHGHPQEIAENRWDLAEDRTTEMSIR